MKIDLATLNYEIAGEGDPLLLVNMHLQTLKSWNSILLDLSRYHRVICFEFPNQGRSLKDSSLVDLYEYALFLKELLLELKIDAAKVVAYGYSFGAHIIRLLAMDFGLSFKAAIIGGINPCGFGPYYTDLLKSWINILETKGIDEFSRFVSLRIFSPCFYSKNQNIHIALAETLHQCYDENPEALKAILTAPINYYSRNKVETPDKYNFPVHVVACDNDLFFPASYVKDYANSIGAETFKLIQDCGHEFIFEKRLDLVNLLHEVMEYYE